MTMNMSGPAQAPVPGPRINRASGLLGTLVAAQTLVREAAYADLTPPLTVMAMPSDAPAPQLSLEVADAEALNRWANWLGGVIHHEGAHRFWLFTEAFGLTVHVSCGSRGV